MVLAAVLAAVSIRAQNVVLELRNGDRVSGVVISESTNRVVLSNVWNGNIVLPAAQIAHRSATATAAPIAAGRTSHTTNAPAPSVALLPAKPVEPQKPKRLAGEVEVGLDILKGTKDRQILHGRAKLTYIKDRFRNMTELSGAYGRTQGIVDADRVDAANKTDFDLRDRVYAYNLLGGGYDHIRSVDVRYEEGPGLGYHLFKRPTFVMNTELGFDYQVEERSSSPDVNRFYGRLGENGTWKINHRFSLDHRFEYLPSVEHAAQFRLRGEANLRYWLMENLTFNLTVLDSYDTAPARDVTPNDLQIRSSIGVRF